MKRAGGEMPPRTTGNPIDTTRTTDPNINTGEPATHYDPRMKSRGGKIKNLSIDEMDGRLKLALTTASEQQSGATAVKLGMVDWQHALLPFEITTMIAQMLPSPKDQAKFALCGRQYFMSTETAFPLRRFPGLSADLKSTCNGQLMARIEHMQTFEKHIQPGGDYDEALLTPLSPAARLTMGLAMMIWSSKYTLARDKKACESLAVTRFKADYKTIKESSPQDVLDNTLALAAQKLHTAPKGKKNKQRDFSFDDNALKLLFQDAMPDDESRQRLASDLPLLQGSRCPEITRHTIELTDRLSFNVLANLVMTRNLNPSLLEKHFVKMTPAEQSTAMDKIITVVEKNLNHFNASDRAFYLDKAIHIFGLALWCGKSMQDDARFSVLTKLVSLIEKTSSLFKINMHDQYGLAFAQHFHMLGFQWKTTNGLVNWAHFHETAQFSQNPSRMALGYLQRMLTDEASKFTDATKSTSLINGINLAFSLN